MLDWLDRDGSHRTHGGETKGLEIEHSVRRKKKVK